MDDRAPGDGLAVGAARRVLVAEDNALIATDLEAILAAAGHAVLGPCASAAEALTLLATTRPDAALLDVTLADGPAEPVAETLAAAGVPFVLATGYDGDPRLDPACYAGAPRLTKPCGAEAVLAALAAVLGTGGAAGTGTVAARSRPPGIPVDGRTARPQPAAGQPAGAGGSRMDGAEDDVAAVARIDAVPAILEVVCRATGMGFAAVARVTEGRWVACAVRDGIGFGLRPGGELAVGTTICCEVRDCGRPVVVGHVAADAAFRDHPTPAMYGFQSYISVPIRRPGGAFFGTLCALDPRPARPSEPETVAMFRLFADLIGFHLDAQERLATSEAALLGERRAAELREQFVAVLAHDLRNPLASIDASLRVLDRAALDERAAAVIPVARASVRRMAGLIDATLDLARGRLGGGLAMERGPVEALGPALEQVVAELRAAWPGRAIEAEVAVAGPVTCDRARVAQLLSNLLGNALEHGAPDRPVAVRAATRAGRLELCVANTGDPIPPAAMARLFQPFFRASARPGRQGLGLGLYIAAEIARGHGGALEVASTPEGTRFTFRMPTARPPAS